jgi:hypothetical protein
MLHLYAIAAEPCRLPPVAGVDGASAEQVALEGGLAAVVSRHDRAPEPGEDAILAHAAVVDALVDLNEAVLPARFADTFADDAALAHAIAARAGELHDGLERVRGCVEIGLRVQGAEPDRAEPSSGADYLRGRLDELRAVERVADDADAALAPLARDSTRRVLSHPRTAVSSAYLLDRGDVAEFRRRVASLAELHPELGVVCGGPWAPYSFTPAEAAT